MPAGRAGGTAEAGSVRRLLDGSQDRRLGRIDVSGEHRGEHAGVEGEPPVLRRPDSRSTGRRVEPLTSVNAIVAFLVWIARGRRPQMVSGRFDMAANVLVRCSVGSVGFHEFGVVLGR